MSEDCEIVRQKLYNLPTKNATELAHEFQGSKQSTNQLDTKGIDPLLMSRLRDPSCSLNIILTKNKLLGTASDQRLAELYDVAKELFELTYHRIPEKHYLAFLGGAFRDQDESDTDIDIVRCFYMSMFTWNTDLLDSLRVLCRKLFFKGESQFIDKILDSFADSWFYNAGSTKPKKLYGNSNGVYLTAYSLILSNTDLHTAEIAKTKKISRSKFVKNTFEALQQNQIPIEDIDGLRYELKKFYERISERKLSLFEPSNSHSRTDSIASHDTEVTIFQNRSSQSDQTSVYISDTDNATPASSENATKSFGFAKVIMMENNLKNKPSHNRKLSLSSNSQHLDENYEPLKDEQTLGSGPIVNHITENDNLQLELVGPPWSKEGIQSVILPEKLLNSLTGMLSLSAFKPSWKSLFVVIFEGELKFFRFDQSGSNAGNFGDGQWWKFATCVNTINLCSCFAQVVDKKSLVYTSMIKHHGYARRRTGLETYWILKIPVPDMITSADHCQGYQSAYFCAGTPETAQEFVDTCNFWAGRSTSIPPAETLSSLDFGWSKKTMSVLRANNAREAEEHLSRFKIASWIPITNGLVPSNLELSEQLAKVETHCKELRLALKQLKEMERVIPQLDSLTAKNAGTISILSKIFNGSDKVDKHLVARNVSVMRANYVNKQNYLANELLRFKCYADILEKAITLRHKMFNDQIV
ncbi:hypothetical protein KL905_002627 [Ogataea polymorpha]|nr:hypothetical protein KL908_001888 [Ogataea polymorpha]KAG7899892.1 hypothetical protein KL935_003433 [Ogataea polymorpha]KAG7906731.1 hypothetical protein KL907_002371 [Ogataea polymorpha]KAG7921862.1 hypothetical protein KL905_002627 [Ogataea polymorpha]